CQRYQHRRSCCWPACHPANGGDTLPTATLQLRRFPGQRRGPNCDGQVLVIHDLVGLYDRFTPKFVKQYANINEPILEALRQYKAEVENRTFPTEAHSFTMKSEELDKLLQLY
ncbi:MAG: 3-methyl-2-oxobutanoate hydroxymethyltransferase, partial [Desulfobulbus sp.]